MRKENKESKILLLICAPNLSSLLAFGVNGRRKLQQHRSTTLNFRRRRRWETPSPICLLWGRTFNGEARRSVSDFLLRSTTNSSKHHSLRFSDKNPTKKTIHSCSHRLPLLFGSLPFLFNQTVSSLFILKTKFTTCC